MRQSVRTIQSWHTFEATYAGSLPYSSATTQWHDIKGAGEKVETLRVPTSPQGKHSLAESRHDHWWRLPDVYMGAKIAPGFPIHVEKWDTIKANARGFCVVTTITECWHTKFGMWGMYDLAKAYRSIKNALPIAESRTGKPAMVTLKIQPDCSTVHDKFLWANIYVRSHLGCGTDSVSSVFCRSHNYFKDAKVMQINRVLKISSIWHSCSINHENNRDLNQGI